MASGDTHRGAALRKLAWFAALWLAGVAVLGVIGLALRSVLGT